MAAGGGVFVMGNRHQLRPDKTLLCDKLQFAGLAHQLRSDQDCEIPNVFSTVARSLLAFEVGVDRHLGNAASTNGVDVVNRRRSALRSHHIDRRI